MDNNMTQKDHDLLIELNTKMDVILGKFDKVEANANEVPTLKDEINRLRGKANLQDAILGIGTIIAGILAVVIK